MLASWEQAASRTPAVLLDFHVTCCSSIHELDMLLCHGKLLIPLTATF